MGVIWGEGAAGTGPECKSHPRPLEKPRSKLPFLTFSPFQVQGFFSELPDEVRPVSLKFFCLFVLGKILDLTNVTADRSIRHLGNNEIKNE